MHLCAGAKRPAQITFGMGGPVLRHQHGFDLQACGLAVHCGSKHMVAACSTNSEQYVLAARTRLQKIVAKLARLVAAVARAGRVIALHPQNLACMFDKLKRRRQAREQEVRVSCSSAHQRMLAQLVAKRAPSAGGATNFAGTLANNMNFVTYTKLFRHYCETMTACR
jgi:hypothetical protein